MRTGTKVRKSGRSRQELSNEYLLAKFGVDTAEKGPLKVCQKLAKNWKKVRRNIGPRRHLSVDPQASCNAGSTAAAWKACCVLWCFCCVQMTFLFLFSFQVTKQLDKMLAPATPVTSSCRRCT